MSKDKNSFDYESQFPDPEELDQSFNLNSFASRSHGKHPSDNGRGKTGKSKKTASGKADPRRKKTAANSDGVDISSRSGSSGKSRRRRKPAKKRGPLAKVGRVMLTVFLICCITGCLVVGAFAVYVFGFVDDTLEDDLNELKMNFTTTVYVKNNETGQYEEYQRLHGSENRIWISIDEIPESKTMSKRMPSAITKLGGRRCSPSGLL